MSTETRVQEPVAEDGAWSGTLSIAARAASAAEYAPVAAPIAGPRDHFLDAGGRLPGDALLGRLSVIVRDPETLYAYWSAGPDWDTGIVHVICTLSDGAEQTQDVATEKGEAWITVPAGASGSVSLEVSGGAASRLLAQVAFEAPPGKASGRSGEGVWRIQGRPQFRHAVVAASAASPDIAAPALPVAGEVVVVASVPARPAPPPEGAGDLPVAPAEPAAERLYHGHRWAEV